MKNVDLCRIQMFSKRTLILLAFLVLSVVACADNAAYQRGERIFFAYCSGCHSLKYTTYPPLAMPESEALNWFGVIPPDLSLSAKYRGQAWLRAYLQGFYADLSRPFGCNNKVLPNTQMPNVLYSLSTMDNYQQVVTDLMAFLMLISEPDKVERHKLGLYVLGFLLLLIFFVWRIIRTFR